MARKRQYADLPAYDEMMSPVLQALIDLGGSGTIEEINGKVYELLKLGEDGTRTEVEYRLAWTRTYLKKYGLLNLQFPAASRLSDN